MFESTSTPARAVSRILIGALAVAAWALIGGSSPGSASASCSATMKGQGSAMQANPQTNVWRPGFIGVGCGTGTNAEPEYTGTSNKEGLEAWDFIGAGAFSHAWSYIATDDAPNATEIAAAKTAAGGSNVVVVPVAQTAIAVIVHPPANCVLEKITNVKLEEAFSGKAETWAAIGGTGTGCAAALTRVVRKDVTGITGQFKDYLALVNTLRNGGTEAVSCAGQPKWSALESMTGAGPPNLQWPECGLIPVIRPGGNGGLEEAEKVVATAGTIGYAALPDAKAKGAATVKVQNNGTSASPTYGAPNKGVEEANCAKIEYSIPKEAMPVGTGLNVDWSSVFGGKPSIGGENYPICMLTYDLGWGNYVTAGFGASVGSWVKAYYEYIVVNGLGANKKWFANMTAAVKSAAEFAVTKVS
jgi:ABC-type phosphate transport system substrate-binding protein